MKSKFEEFVYNKSDQELKDIIKFSKEYSLDSVIAAKAELDLRMKIKENLDHLDKISDQEIVKIIEATKILPIEIIKLVTEEAYRRNIITEEIYQEKLITEETIDSKFQLDDIEKFKNQNVVQAGKYLQKAVTYQVFKVVFLIFSIIFFILSFRDILTSIMQGRPYDITNVNPSNLLAAIFAIFALVFWINSLYAIHKAGILLENYKHIKNNTVLDKTTVEYQNRPLKF